MRLLYQNPDGRWSEISADLKTSGHTDSILTHVGLVAIQGKIDFNFAENNPILDLVLKRI